MEATDITEEFLTAVKGALTRLTDKEQSPSVRLGYELVLTGLKENGSPYANRRLNNVSIRRANEKTWFHGYDPEAKGIRLFRMDLVRHMTVERAPVEESQEVAV